VKQILHERQDRAAHLGCPADQAEAMSAPAQGIEHAEKLVPLKSRARSLLQPAHNQNASDLVANAAFTAVAEKCTESPKSVPRPQSSCPVLSRHPRLNGIERENVVAGTNPAMTRKLGLLRK